MASFPASNPSTPAFLEGSLAIDQARPTSPLVSQTGLSLAPRTSIHTTFVPALCPPSASSVQQLPPQHISRGGFAPGIFGTTVTSQHRPTLAATAWQQHSESAPLPLPHLPPWAGLIPSAPIEQRQPTFRLTDATLQRASAFFTPPVPRPDGRRAGSRPPISFMTPEEALRWGVSEERYRKYGPTSKRGQAAIARSGRGQGGGMGGGAGHGAAIVTSQAAVGGSTTNENIPLALPDESAISYIPMSPTVVADDDLPDPDDLTSPTEQSTSPHRPSADPTNEDSGVGTDRVDNERADNERADDEQADGDRADDERADDEQADDEQADDDDSDKIDEAELSENARRQHRGPFRWRSDGPDRRDLLLVDVLCRERLFHAEISDKKACENAWAQLQKQEQCFADHHSKDPVRFLRRRLDQLLAWVKGENKTARLQSGTEEEDIRLKKNLEALQDSKEAAEERKKQPASRRRAIKEDVVVAREVRDRAAKRARGDGDETRTEASDGPQKIQKRRRMADLVSSMADSQSESSRTALKSIRAGLSASQNLQQQALKQQERSHKENSELRRQELELRERKLVPQSGSELRADLDAVKGQVSDIKDMLQILVDRRA